MGSEMCIRDSTSAGMSDVTNVVLGGTTDTWVGEGPSHDPETPGDEVPFTTEKSALELDYARLGACILWPVVQEQAKTIATLQEAVVALVEDGRNMAARIQTLEARA